VRFDVGETYVVRILLDHKTNRVIGTSKLQAFLKRDVEGLAEGDKVNLLIYERSPLGWKALINNTYAGLIYQSEAPDFLKIGHTQQGYIRHVREDGKIDLRLSAEGRQGTDEGREVLLEKLKENEGFLPVHDKSDPQQIFELTGMSKKLFKKSLGGLYRERLVQITPEGIKLVDQGS
jgi:predicted RNA-binding protein (virulence factor B family)